MARLMALDVGEARIGVAVSDANGFLASPYSTIYVTRDEQQTWRSIQDLVIETEAERVIIGLPISLDGHIHAQGARVKTFAERLQPHLSVPFVFWDERLSTVEAQRLLAQSGQERRGKSRKQGGRKKRRSGQEIDALAAAVILQDYLDNM